MNGFVWSILLLVVSPSALSQSAEQLCDEASRLVGAQYQTHRYLPDDQLIERTGHPHLYYQVVLDQEQIEVHQLSSMRADSAKTRSILVALSVAGKAEKISFLLENGFSPKVTSDEGAPIVLIAAACNRINVVSVLLDAGADVQSHDKQGIDAMASAIMEDFEELAVILLEHGYKVDAGERSGNITLGLSKRLHGGKYYRLIRQKKWAAKQEIGFSDP